MLGPRSTRSAIRSARGSGPTLGTGLRWGFPVGPVELGLRPHAGLSWTFNELRFRSDIFKPSGQGRILDESFGTASAVLGADLELLPFAEKSGLYLYAGGGYEIPFSHREETLTRVGPSISIGFLRQESIEIHHAWFLRAGVGWRFEAPF